MWGKVDISKNLCDEEHHFLEKKVVEVLMYRVTSNIAPTIVSELFSFSNINYNLRSGSQFHQPSANIVWNSLETISYLKLVSAIIYQIFIFSPFDSPLKLWKMLFISSKKLFSLSRYSNFCDFLPSFPHFPDSKGQMEIIYDVMNWLA